MQRIKSKVGYIFGVGYIVQKNCNESFYFQFKKICQTWEFWLQDVKYDTRKMSEQNLT